MLTIPFIFRPGTYDEDFRRLDAATQVGCAARTAMAAFPISRPRWPRSADRAAGA